MTDSEAEEEVAAGRGPAVSEFEWETVWATDKELRPAHLLISGEAAEQFTYGAGNLRIPFTAIRRCGDYFLLQLARIDERKPDWCPEEVFRHWRETFDKLAEKGRWLQLTWSPEGAAKLLGEAEALLQALHGRD